jgi:hypothetical protein
MLEAGEKRLAFERIKERNIKWFFHTPNRGPVTTQITSD